MLAPVPTSARVEILIRRADPFEPPPPPPPPPPDGVGVGGGVGVGVEVPAAPRAGLCT
jgi:hypothetical protein